MTIAPYAEPLNQSDGRKLFVQLSIYTNNICKNILYYILYLLRKNEDTIVKQAFRTSLELHCNGKNSFYHNLMKISEYYDLPDFDPNNLSEAKIKHHIDIIKQNSRNDRFCPVCNSGISEEEFHLLLSLIHI